MNPFKRLLTAALMCTAVQATAWAQTPNKPTLVIGEVKALRQSTPGGSALVYLRGQYHELGGAAA